MVIPWLLSSLSKEIKVNVIYSKIAKELWDCLQSRFGKSNGAKLYHLQKELNGLVQGNSDISGYFTNLKRLWDELESLNCDVICTCDCTCQGKEKLTKSMQDQRLIQFLMGLNDVYSHARGHILMINPLPSIDHAYSLLIQDASQREIYANSHVFSDSSSFMVTNQGRNDQKPGNQVFKGANNFQKSGNYPKKFRNSYPQSYYPQKFGNSYP
ncbi:uncharacterized protein LOC132611782 [Lycium barbarum]|uniref:uncharacterized protein LOC132611782 n=1 Tax=Lycium barbarum TaxID=112863 RepID=UPI00293E23C3|nr:uncharacterized protein LOC132611782 [Lycium barbarum]